MNPTPPERPVDDADPFTWPAERFNAAIAALRAVADVQLLRMEKAEREAALNHWLRTSPIRNDAIVLAERLRRNFDAELEGGAN